MSVLIVKWFDPPRLPDPQPGDEPIFRWDKVAHIRAGEIVSEVHRVAYWNEADRKPLEVGFEVKIDGMPETGGMANIVADKPNMLLDLAAVATTAAQILGECNAGIMVNHAGISQKSDGDLDAAIEYQLGSLDYIAAARDLCELPSASHVGALGECFHLVEHVIGRLQQCQGEIAGRAGDVE
jgi:hypothetical protein